MVLLLFPVAGAMRPLRRWGPRPSREVSSVGHELDQKKAHLLWASGTSVRDDVILHLPEADLQTMATTSWLTTSLRFVS